MEEIYRVIVPQYQFTIPIKLPSWNQFYAGKHWTKRKCMRDDETMWFLSDGAIKDLISDEEKGSTKYKYLQLAKEHLRAVRKLDSKYKIIQYNKELSLLRKRYSKLLDEELKRD